MEPSDREALYELQSDPLVTRYLDAPPWNERLQADQFLAASIGMATEGSGVRLAIEAQGTFVGWASVRKWDANVRSLNLGYCLSPSAWGKGYATEVVAALLGWAFATVDVNRMQAEVDTRNPASARVLEKMGFVREVHRREDYIVSGEASDTWMYSLLRREWLELSE